MPGIGQTPHYAKSGITTFFSREGSKAILLRGINLGKGILAYKP